MSFGEDFVKIRSALAEQWSQKYKTSSSLAASGAIYNYSTITIST